MKLVVDMYKDSGKWYATAELPVTDDLINQLLRKYGYSFQGVKEYILENQKEVTRPYCDEFWWAVRLEDQPPESSVFCLFLRRPYQH
jgi:hypothetical protein